MEKGGVKEGRYRKPALFAQGIARQQSQAVQGIAILLMLYHHFFSDVGMYGDRLTFWNGEAVQRGAWFGKICVGLFAFISGYGMFYVLRRQEEDRFFPRLLTDYQAVLRQLLSVYRKYWLAFLLIPVPELLAGVREFEPGEFFSNLLAFSSTYQSTWWYMGQYVKMLLLLPLLELFFFPFQDRRDKKRRLCFFIVLLTAAGAAAVAGLIWPPLGAFLLQTAKNLRISFLLPFGAGFLAARFRVYQRLGHKLEKPGRAGNAAAAGLALIATVGVRVRLADYAAYAEFDFLLVPVFVYGALTLLWLLPPVEKLFVWFGKQSAYMWLVHGFLYARSWMWLTEYIHSGWLLYLVMAAASAAAALLLAAPGRIWRRHRAANRRKKALDN